MSSPYELKWGILGCGWIASVFTKDLLLDTAARGAGNIKHTVVAAGTSSDLGRAQKFLDDCGVPSGTAAAYGSYETLVQDPNVEIVYVATPHSHHFPHVLLALKAGKHVLCEKPFTVNAEQARILYDVAKEKNLFLMEAVWTRFFPLSIEVRNLVKSGKIGEVKRVLADTSFLNEMETKFPPENRMVNMDLAGGALLDLGVYSLTWVFQILYHLDENPKTPKVVGHIQKYAVTGCDETATVICQFEKATGIAMTSCRVGTDVDEEGTAGPAIRIYGTKGEIQVAHPAFRPLKYRVILPKEEGGAGEWQERKDAGGAMYWQADGCARSIREGKLECEVMPWKESIAIMEVMDEMRKQADMPYPEAIESTAH
ncbi:hypothetical protein H072_5942 [Dactylellina haptotyla CBS 200.50]|uniref:D-xylose 1-dehydrogenase (NADP(+), D-xylono-1,5-lactone-forming) n=1 Tax=Dactylellina haptotyla (strain CBS 200.50) TaxID=1284197 RepID=S8BY45_DACHA|nr:hypothetical protein H072_5942 [Dactylellina haptotyla CBS 200.50]